MLGKMAAFLYHSSIGNIIQIFFNHENKVYLVLVKSAPYLPWLWLKSRMFPFKPPYLGSTILILQSIQKSVKNKSPLTLLLLFPCNEPHSKLHTLDHTAHIIVHNTGMSTLLLTFIQLIRTALYKNLSCYLNIFFHMLFTLYA